MPLQDRFIFRFGFILTVIFISLVLVNPRRSFAGDVTQDVRISAEQGNAKAQCELGYMYDFGQGVPQDYKKAIRWYRKAAEQGYAEAQYNLGHMYDKGQGVPQDYKEAVRWYRKAVEQGYAKAQYNLGYMYSIGQGVPQDYKEAVRWCRKAAEQGVAKAQCVLGLMYDFGQGVPQDYIRAYAWFNLAASQGNTDAAGFRNNLADTFMTPQQIAVAQELTVELQDKIENRSSATTSETEKSQSKGVGTGFFITRDGYILTCYHVVEKANSVQVLVGDKMYEADIEQIDIHNDLSLLKIRGVFSAIAFSPARSVKLGESIFTIGYPNPDFQGYAAKLTRGEINSLSGYRDDPRLYQISAPVQPGNSGGALVDENGHVVGIVVAVLDAWATLKITGALPQNVNYAIKGTYALAFLDALPEVSRKLILPEKNPKKSSEKIVDHVKKCTVMIVTY
jgi:TPR repeat protein